MFSIIKPRGDIKTNWESVNPVLRLREWGVEWEETVGTGDIKVKIGDGVKHWNELDYAIVNDVTKKIVKTFAEVNSDDNPNPILNPGESIDALFGKIKQKFEYATNFMTSLKNMVGDYQARSFNTGSGTVTADDLKSAIDILEQYKLTTANILDVNDSTNTFAALSANQGRLINEKAVANANAISTLNSNLGVVSTTLGNVVKPLTNTDIGAILGTMTRNASAIINDKLVCISVTILTPNDGIGIPADTPFFRINRKQVLQVCPVLTGGMQNAYVFTSITDSGDTVYHIRPGITQNTEIFMNFVGLVYR